MPEDILTSLTVWSQPPADLTEAVGSGTDDLSPLDLEPGPPPVALALDGAAAPADHFPKLTVDPDVAGAAGVAPPSDQALGDWWQFTAPGGPEAFYEPVVHWRPELFDGAGDPTGDAPHWRQQEGPASCAVVAQISVLESITGRHMAEDEICRVAAERGWFDPERGTSPRDMGQILHLFGVETEVSWGASIMDIAHALERGDKVIVGLDAAEIWTPLRDGTTHLPIQQPDAGHAVWVTGIDVTSGGEIRVILNDSGHPAGQMMAADVWDFENAWNDFGRQMVVAHTPPSLSA